MADEHGVPMHSWRVLLLPFLDNAPLYEEYRFDEPWNGPHNRQLIEQMPGCYRCPSHGHHGEAAGEFHSNYVVVVDPRGVFRGQHATTIDEISDGDSSTIAVVEVSGQSVPWMAPDDISADEFLESFHPDAERNHTHGTNVLLADGSTRFLRNEIDLDILAALLTSDAGDEVTGLEE